MKCIFFSLLFILLLPVCSKERSFTRANVKEGVECFKKNSFLQVNRSSTPKYFKTRLRLHMDVQNGNTCLPSIMAYVNQEQCGGRRSAAYYIQQYEYIYPGIDVEEDGIVGSQRDVVSFINRYFQTLSYQMAGGLTGSIDAGHPIFTTIISRDSRGHEQLHNILIVGYDSSSNFNPRLYYMDPRYGRIFGDMNLVNFNTSRPAYVLAIGGCK